MKKQALLFVTLRKTLSRNVQKMKKERDELVLKKKKKRRRM